MKVTTLLCYTVFQKPMSKYFYKNNIKETPTTKKLFFSLMNIFNITEIYQL